MRKAMRLSRVSGGDPLIDSVFFDDGESFPRQRG